MPKKKISNENTKLNLRLNLISEQLRNIGIQLDIIDIDLMKSSVDFRFAAISKDINDATTIFILAFTLLYLAGVSIGIYVHISNVILIASLIVAVLLVIGAYIGLANTFKSARTELQSIQNEGRTQIKEKRDEKQGGM